MSAVQRLPVGRAGQALAVGIALLGLLLVWTVAVEPLLDWYDQRQEATERQAALVAHSEGLAASLPMLRRQATVARNQGPPQTALLAGSSDAVAAATLQGRISDLVTGAGTALSSTEALPARQVGGYRRIALRVSFTGDLAVFTHLLQALNGAEPRMLVDDIQLHTSPIVVMQQKPGSAPSLDVSMTVIGFRAGSAPEATDNAGGADQGGTGDQGDQGQ